MCNKSILCILLVCVSVTFLRGQTERKEYKGRVLCAESGKGLENVICQALDAEGRLIDYDISDKEGYFSLKIGGNIRAVRFKLLGYNDRKIPVKELSLYQNEIKMEVSDFELPEVVVSVPPIRSHKDTLTYNVGSFKGQEDRYIVDVLKKLPGIKVADNGTISYQGEAINKFYIEGRDLLGGQYNLATNNLDVEAVSSVEVLENNQHIKALKGVKFSEKAAINLKLKKGYTVRPFGEMQLGAGASPFLYDGRAFTAYLGSQLQAMAHFKGGNTGRFILGEMEDKLDVNNLFSFELLDPDMIVAPAPRYIPLPSEKHLFNKTYLGSANALVPVSEDSELKINFAYGSDRTRQDFGLLQRLATGGDVLEITEESKLKKVTDNSRLSLSYEHNSFSSYIRDEAVYYRKKETTNSAVRRNDRNLSVFNANELYYFQNAFQALFKIKDKRTLNVNSFLRWGNHDEALNQAYAIPGPEMDEFFKGKYITSKNQIGSSFSLWNNRLYLDLNLIYRKRDIENTLQVQPTDAEPAFQPAQQNKTERLQLGFTPAYQIKTKNGKFIFLLNLPVSYSKYSVGKRTENKPEDVRFIFSPAFSSTYKMDHQWELYTKLGYDFDYAEELSLWEAPYVRSYQSIYIPSGTFNSSSNYYGAGSIRYKNIVNMLFFNINVLYREMAFNYINKFYNTSEWSYYTTVGDDYRGHLLSVFADVSKTVVPWKLALTLSPSYTRSKTRLIQQDIPMRNVSHVVSLLLKAELKAIDKLSVSYSAKGRAIWNENKMTESHLLKDLTQHLALYFFPIKNADISVTSDYIVYEREENRYSSYFFLDIAGTYKYKRMEFGITASNILDDDIFSKTDLSAADSYYQQIPLRGREILLSVKFKF